MIGLTFILKEKDLTGLKWNKIKILDKCIDYIDVSKEHDSEYHDRHYYHYKFVCWVDDHRFAEIKYDKFIDEITFNIYVPESL